jgi:hypothetical protein
MFHQNDAASGNSKQNLTNSSTPSSTFPSSQGYHAAVQPSLPQHPTAYSNGDMTNAIVPYNQHSQLKSTNSWDGQPAYGMNSQQQALSYGTLLSLYQALARPTIVLCIYLSETVGKTDSLSP